MNYSELRHFADSYGLVFILATFLTLIGWSFRKGSKRAHTRAAMSIFEDEDRDDG